MSLVDTRVSRREFLARSGAGVAGAAMVVSAVSRLRAYPLDGVMGLQSFDVRTFLANDLNGTLKTLAGWGYKALDLVVPTGPDQPAQYRKALDAAGMVCHNGHFSAAMFEDAAWKNTMDVARTLGVKEMVCAGGAPSGRGGGTPVTVDNWKTYAETLNKYGAKT